jgi:DNA-binding Lrp family transcriptional regulator
MSVPPGQLAEVATILAGHGELAFVAATTGPTNLVAHALCPDPAALHRYLTERLGSLAAIRTLETAPVLRTVKSASPVPWSPP